MKTSVLRLPVLLLAFLLAGPFGRAADAAVEAVRRVDAARVDAMVAGDTTALAGYMTDDCLYVHSNGNAQTKAEFLAMLSSGEFKYLSARYGAIRLRAYGGHTAVVTGRSALEVETKAGRRQLDLLFTAVYVDVEGGWKLASYQSTPAPKS